MSRHINTFKKIFKQKLHERFKNRFLTDNTYLNEYDLARLSIANMSKLINPSVVLPNIPDINNKNETNKKNNSTFDEEYQQWINHLKNE